ncbi:hypothetical protein [Maridesulfovibrio bastinii]|uniref:hypothetical protein n=1 Tax=Maridesulfovibrio bastinii TaxID=47157 RepID=UPI0004092BAB|nr:hypothetical protein [Maridesulfovibrio bastinii]
MAEKSITASTDAVKSRNAAYEIMEAAESLEALAQLCETDEGKGTSIPRIHHALKLLAVDINTNATLIYQQLIREGE